MPLFHVTVYLHVGPDNFAGLKPGDPLATDTDLQLTVTAADPDAAAEQAYAIGNRIDTDDRDHPWPTDVRSVSVGDLLQITYQRQTVFRAVTAIGFHAIPEMANPVVPLAGTRATSRRHPPADPRLERPDLP
jgi:hypothetical protein